MTVASPPKQAPDADTEAQALFEEARRRRRRRRRWWSAAVLVAAVVALVVAQIEAGGPTGAPPSRVGGSRTGRVTATKTASTPPAYPATGWTTPGILSGVSCTGSMCVTVGYSGAEAGSGPGPRISGSHGTAHILTSTDGGARWVVGSVPAGVTDATAVTCAGATSCVAVGQGTGGSTDGAVALVSVDAGASWTRSTVPRSTLPLAAVSCPSTSDCAAVAGWPTNAAPGPPGTDAVFSTDGGRTWTAAPLPAAVAALATVSCTPGGFCLAGGTGPGTTANGNTPPVLVASTDGGARWSSVPVPTGYFDLGHLETTIEIGTVLCTTGEHCLLTGLLNGTKSGDAFFTNDGGATWSESAGWESAGGEGPGIPSSISCPSSTTCVAVAMSFSFETATVLVSDDGGASWHDASDTAGDPYSGNGTPGDSFATLSALTCVSSSACVVVGQNQRGWLYAATTADGGATWTPSPVPVPVGALDGVSCWSATACLAVGSSPADVGVALTTKDGGAHWTDVPLPAGTPPLDAVSCAGTGRCVAVGQDPVSSSPAVALSTGDGGEVWDTAPLPAGTAVATLDCATPSVCWVGGTSGGIFGPAYLAESSDGGHSWQPSALPTGLPGIAGLSCSGPDDCLAVTADADLVADPVKGSAVIRLVGTTEGGRWQRVGTIPPVWAPTGVGDTISATPQSLQCTGAGDCLLATADERGAAPSWRGRVLATTDDGLHWTVTGKSPDDYQALDAIACPGGDSCVGVGSGPPNQGAGVIATSAAGTHPAVVAIPGGVGNLYGVTCPSAARCVAVGTAVGSAAVLVTADGGRTWRPASLPPWLAASTTTG